LGMVGGGGVWGGGGLGLGCGGGGGGVVGGGGGGVGFWVWFLGVLVGGGGGGGLGGVGGVGGHYRGWVRLPLSGWRGTRSSKESGPNVHLKGFKGGKVARPPPREVMGPCRPSRGELK